MGTDAEWHEYLSNKAARTTSVDWSWRDEAGHTWSKPSDILERPELNDPRSPWLQRHKRDEPQISSYRNRPRSEYLQYLNHLIARGNEMKQTQQSPVDNIKDAEDAFAFVRGMADDAHKVAALLVQFERGHMSQYHGVFNGSTIVGRDASNYDPATAGRCRTIASALHEFANTVKTYAAACS